MQKTVKHFFYSLQNIEIWLLVILSFLSFACIRGDKNTSTIARSGSFGYNLNDPDETYMLPDELTEISGLDYLKDNTILGVEDENGILYFFDLDSRKVIRKIEFARSGDYEGVTHINQKAYVIKSNGDLFVFPIDQEDKVDADKISTAFKSSNNVEGLSRGHSDDMLYMACKDDAGIKSNNLKGRAVYGFDLKERKLDSDPYIHLTSASFKTLLRENDLSPFVHMPFKPSGIAIHPITQDIFLIASVGKLLVILNQEGQIKSMVPLSGRILNQPEGICFDPSGNLFISSEGRKKRGYIQRFNVKN